MPSVFISYSHNPADPTHADRVAGLAASLWRDGLKVFFDQKRGVEEEKLPWPIWMEGKIEEADHVLLVCTELYLKKVRQQVSDDQGQGVCWEANVIYALLYERKLNTTKFSPVLFSPADRRFIPALLKGRDCFMVDSQLGYNRLYAFLTDQHRIHFPEQGATLQTVAQKTVQALFALPGEVAPPARTGAVPIPEKPIAAATPQLTLKPDTPPVPRHDIRGLDWYDECDAGHFIGRSDDANQILGKLMSHPILRLVGASGVGKSSLVRAGLLPKIRESGWRACVIRPFEDPAQCIPSQLTTELLTSPGAFTTPLDPAKFRADVAPLLTNNGVNALVLFFDQFEDIVSPVAAQAAVDTMREFLRELWEQKEIKPYLRAVVVYRTDADVRLGRLWQEVSGRSEGLPYFTSQGLKSSVVETIINQTAWEQGWRLETSIPEIARQLALESEKLDRSGEVFPVYLQIFLKQAELNIEKCITTEFIASLGGVSGLIDKYLEQALARLKIRGGDWQQCGAVLESLSRSTGAKAAQSLNDLVRETGLSHAVLVEMLPVLINQRLVRPVGNETYEIQHDRLATAVIESMKDSDRDAKAARELLAAKVSVFKLTMVSLRPDELVYLYRHRQKIHPTERELQLLLTSIFHHIEAGDRNKSPGAYWFGESSPQDFLRWFIQIEHWAAKERSSLRPSLVWWAETFPLCSLESQFAVLAADPVPSVRTICAHWIGRTKRDNDLPLLRELAKDQDWWVHTAAMEALASFSLAEALPILRELARDQNSGVRTAALTALASFARPEDLPLFRELAKNQDSKGQGWRVGKAAVEALAHFTPAQVLPLLRELARDQNSDLRAAALTALGSFVLPEDLPLFRELAKDQDPGVHAEAIKALTSLIETQASLSRPEALPLLRELAKDQDSGMRARAMMALASFSRPEALPLLRELARDRNWDVRARAVKALASFAQAEDLPLLSELARDRNWNVRARAVKALASFSRSEDLPLLSELAKDQDPGVRAEAIKALTSLIETQASLSRPEALPLLLELAKDRNSDVRARAVKALASLSRPEALPLMRELAKDQDPGVRAEAMKALASFSRPEDLPLMRELAKDQDPGVRAEAMKALASFSRPEDLPLMRELAEDRNSDMRARAVKALANLSGSEALPLLRKLARDQNSDVRAAAVQALERFSQPEALSVLYDQALAPDDTVAVEAIRGLSTRCSREELEVFLNRHDQKLCAGTLAALDELLYMPEWMKPKDRE